MAEAAELDALMGRLADGDRSAFSPLFRALWGPALKVCQRLVHGEADAADAAQAAMMKIYKRTEKPILHCGGAGAVKRGRFRAY